MCVSLSLCDPHNMDTHTQNYHNNLPARRHRNLVWRLDVSKQKILPCLGQTIPPLPAFPEEFSECISKFHAWIPVTFVEGMPSPTTPLQGILQYRGMCEAKSNDGRHVDKYR